MDTSKMKKVTDNKEWNEERAIRNGFNTAFPNNTAELDESTPGVSKREYFAGIALQGLISNKDFYKETVSLLQAASSGIVTEEDIISEITERAVWYADAVLKSLTSR